MTESLLLLVSALLVLACGVFVAAEFALVTVDRATVEHAAAEGDRRALGVQSALRSLSTQLSGAQVGITITNLVIGFLAEPAIAALIEGPLESAGLAASAVRPVSVGIGLVLATGLTMVFGELVPKNLAIASSFAVARATQGVQRGFTTAMAIPIRALNGAANGIVRLLGVEPQEELRSVRNANELASLVRRSAVEGTLDPDTATLVERSVSFGPRMAGEIMTPRVQMTSVGASDPAAAVIEAARTSGRSRFPAYGDDVDDVVGAVHVKRVVALPVDRRHRVRVRELMIEPVVVPETLRLDPLLRLLRDDELQMAVVVDEYGGTAGVVTLEDVIEEIVGDIADEHDRRGADVQQRSDGSWVLSGLLRPDEVEEASGIRLPEEDDYDTVAGLVLAQLGRLAAPGDAIEIELPPSDPDETGETLVAVIVVERVEGRRIDRLSLDVREAEIGDE